MSDTDAWYRVADAGSIPSPTLLFYPERIRSNTAEAVRVAGSPQRLRPHVKTNKCPQVVSIMREHGISRFKCATLAEAAMLAAAGVTDIVIAYPMVGPNLVLLTELCRTYPDASFRPTVESVPTLELLGSAAAKAGLVIEAVLDLDVGMHRTGASSVEEALALYRRIDAHAHLRPGGIHAYDGHVHERDLTRRREIVGPTIRTVREMADTLRADGVEIPRIIAGGTPTFPCYADDAPEFELSPGTCFLHDWGYLEGYPDLEFSPAALILGRVVSRPGAGLITIDVGSKAIAADPAGPRGTILNLPNAEPLGQSEEHWVFRLSARDAARMPSSGEEVYVLPRHICPSVALHAQAVVVDGSGSATETWPITARDRAIKGMRVHP